MATKQERIESKQEEFSAKSDYWLGKYLEVRGNTKEDQKEREKYRKEWLKSQRSLKKNERVFDAALRDYKDRSGSAVSRNPATGTEVTPAGQSDRDGRHEEAREEINISLEDLKSEREQLKAEIEGRLKDKVGIQKVVQDFYDQGVQPDDLLGRKGGDNQARAIQVLFADNPVLGKKIERIIFMTESEKSANQSLFDDTYSFIQKAEKLIKEGYDNFSKTKKSMDQFSEEVTGDYLKKKLTNSIEYFKEKPLAGVMGIAAIGGVLYYLSHGEKDSFREKTWNFIKGVAPWVGGAIGLNIATSMYRDDGRSAFDLIFHNPDAYSYDTVTEQFKTDLEAMTDNNRNAFEAMLHLANADADAVYEVFDDAERSHKGTINPQTLLSLGGITKKQAESISGENLYIGMEGMMRKLGQKKGVKRSKDEEITEGKIAYKKMTTAHPGLKFASIIYLMEVDIAKANAKKHGKTLDGTVIAGLGGAGSRGVAGGGSGESGESGSGESGSDGTETPSFLDELHGDEENIEGVRVSMEEYIKEQFARLDGYESGWTDKAMAFVKDSKFKTFIGSRKVFYSSEMTRIMSGKTDADVEQVKIDLKQLAGKLKDEVSEYTAQLSNQDPNSEIVLHDVESVVVQNMVKDTVWKGNTLNVFDTLQLYTMESTYFTDEPEMDLKFVEMYVKKIDYGMDRGGKVPFSVAEEYTTAYIDQIHAILPNDPEYLSGGKRQVSVAEWEACLVKMRDFPSFQVWVNDKHHEIGEVLKENDRTRAVTERRIEEGGDFQAEKEAELSKIFDRTDNMEWSIIPSEFDAFVRYRQEMYDKRIKAKMAGVTNPQNARADVDVILAEARKEVLLYTSAESRQGSSTEVVLDQVEREMINNILGQTGWSDEAGKVLSFTKAFNEFEGSTYVINEPEMEVAFMDIYFQKIDFGKSAPDQADDAGDYTRYFIDKAYNFLPKDNNVGGVGGTKRQISPTEWAQIKPSLNTIQSYNQWKISRQKVGEIPVFDAAKQLRRREIDERGDLMSDTKKEIEAIFKPLDNLEWSFTADSFDAFVGTRRVSYMKEVTDAIAGKNLADSRTAIEPILDRARAEAESYASFGMSENTDSKVLLRKVEGSMIDNIIKNKDWQPSARKVLNYADTSYEFEGCTYLFDDPQIFTDYMDTYFRKIGNGISLKDGASADEYTKYFLWEMTNILPNDANVAATNTDGRVKQISVAEWQTVENQRDQILSYEEWAKSPQTRPELKINDQARASKDRERAEGSYIEQYAKDRKADIDRSFDPVSKLSFNFMPSTFQALIGKRKEFYYGQLDQLSKDKTKAKAMDAVAERADDECKDYLKFEARTYTSSEEVLTEIETIMIDNTIAGAKPDYWKDEARKVFLWSKGKYEMEGNSFVIDDPEMMNSLMKLYFDKIELGKTVTSSKDTAHEYTKFFIYQVNALLPNKENTGLGTKKAVSSDEWSKAQVALNSIDSYAQWIAHGQKSAQELTENDPQALIEIREREEKAESQKVFMKWFDKEMDPSEWLRADGIWPGEFRKDVENRLYILSNSPDYKNTTNGEYQKTLQDYAKYVRVEKRFYNMMIQMKLDPEQRLYANAPLPGNDKMRDYVTKTITQDFEANFKAGASPQAFNTALQDHFAGVFGRAQIIDMLSVQIGGVLFPGIDLLQFTPGGY